MDKYLLKFRIFLWLILAIIVGWLLYLAIVPGGKISYVYDFNKQNYFIGKLTPAERVWPVVNGEQKIVADPVYFSLRTPRKFTNAKLTFKYKDYGMEQCGEKCLPLIEAGVLMDKIVWRYDLKPVENKIIDRLALVWPTIMENGQILLQRDNKFQTIDEFLKNLPPKNEISLYNYDLALNFNLADYKKATAETKINYAIRGAYEFYTYVKDEDLDWQFDFNDLNKNKDRDNIEMSLYFNDQKIESKKLEDFGPVADDGKISERGQINFKIADLPEGVYKFQLRVNDDIITKQITTKQNKISFINKIWLADGAGKNIKLFTDSQVISAQTINPAKLQIIKVGETDLPLPETYKQFSQKNQNNITPITLEKDDVILSGNGVFCFEQNSLINLAIKKLTSDMDIISSAVNYVLADYISPEKSDGWKIATAEFDLNDAYEENGKYSFIISLPGLKSDDEIKEGIIVDEIRVELTGKNLWQKVSEIAKLLN